MSSSVFCSALSRALSRSPLSPLTVSRLNSTFTTVQQQRPSEAGKPPHTPPSKQHSSRIVDEPGCPARPSPLSTRHGRKIPKLLVMLRDLKLAKDIPGPARGKRNLVHTDPKSPKKRALRRKEDEEWARKHGKPAKKARRELSYYEQVRRYKLDLARVELSPAMKERAKFSRRKERDERLSLSSITREYMEAVAWFTKCSFSPFYDNSRGPRIYAGLDPDIVVITKTFTYKNRWFLQLKGYDPWDVVVWGWILAAKDAEQAGWRMKIYQEGLPKNYRKEIEETRTEPQVVADGVSSGSQSSSSSDTDLAKVPTSKCDAPEPPAPKRVYPIAPPKPFPTFLILHTVRRKPLSRTTLNYLIAGGSAFLSQLRSDYKSKTLFIVRLLRRIQEENVLALPYLVQLIVTHLELTPETSVQHLTFLYNRLLSLIARPPHERPFQYHPVIQQSQFMLLRKMSVINILITREGYRAIISVQLARAKTLEERERIKGMKMSWPPWQEERNAWSDKLDRGRVTRAGVVLRQMQDAGYAIQEWESAAAVLAGEDTDWTPTIATRTYLRLPPSSSIAKSKEKFERGSKEKQVLAGKPISSITGNNRLQEISKKLGVQPRTSHHDRGETLVWRARIRATRTLEEAWAIFLDARSNINPTGGMYQELFEKVVASDRLHREKDSVPSEGASEDSNRNALPSEDSSTMEFLPSLPKRLTPEQRLMVLRDHANELFMKQLQEEKYRPGKPVPGEGKEVLPAPFSPSEGGVHVPIPPPTLSSLYHMMHQDNFQPTQDLLILLVKKAQDMETADRLLGEKLVNEIWSGYDSLSSNGKLKKPNWRLLTAYLQALINSGFIQRAIRLLIITSTRKDDPTWRYLPAWNVILKALVNWKFRAYPISWKRAPALVESNVGQRKSWLYLVWKLYVHMRDLKIDIDGQTMMNLCTAARKIMQLEEDVRKGRGDMEVEEILWDGKKPWEQVVDVFRKLVGNVQHPTERDTEIQALKEKAMDFNKWESEREAAKEEEKPEPVLFWAEFDESKDEPKDVTAELTEQANHPQLDRSIDPDYYTPYPPPPPPPPPLPRIPEPENSSAVIASKYTPPLYIPNFAVLHTYIRVLGLADQKKEVILTLSWMARLARGEGNSGGISLPLKGTNEVGTTEGEKRRVRMCIIAVRAFLEEDVEGGGEWQEVARMLVDGKRGDGETGEEKLWGGWPSIEEVERYKRQGMRE